jgi:hypothetical protein
LSWLPAILGKADDLTTLASPQKKRRIPDLIINKISEAYPLRHASCAWVQAGDYVRP